MKEYLDYCGWGKSPSSDAPCGCPNAQDMYNGLSKLPQDAAVTMAYVPFQTDASMYSPEKALFIGTAFPTLDKPFLAGGCVQR